MNRSELTKLIRGPMAAVATPFDADFRLDLGVVRDLAQWWVGEGLVTGRAVIKVAAAMGEGPDLGDDEWPHLLRTVVNAAPEATILCALKSKYTTAAIEDAKRAEALGAVGVQIDLPFYHYPTQDDLLRYFTDISASIGIGILIYNTWWFGCESIQPATIRRLAETEHVVAIKWDVPPDADYDSMREFTDVMNVIDNSMQPVRCHRNGGHGYIAPLLDVHPPHDLALWEALEAGRYDDAQALFDRVNAPVSAYQSKASQRSGGYRVKKGLMEIVGHPAGPPRPPTLPLDEDELHELRDLVSSFGWQTSPIFTRA